MLHESHDDFGVDLPTPPPRPNISSSMNVEYDAFNLLEYNGVMDFMYNV